MGAKVPRLHVSDEKTFTFVRADNPAARATYQNQGFSVVGTARKHAKLAGPYIEEVLIEIFFDSESAAGVARNRCCSASRMGYYGCCPIQ